MTDIASREIILAPEQTLCEAVGVPGMELLNLQRLDAAVGSPSPHKAFSAMPDFDTYFKSLGSQHPEKYGKEWDSHYKTKFETKPPPKPPGSSPSQPAAPTSP